MNPNSISKEPRQETTQESHNCEICGGHTGETSLCSRCQTWVQHYMAALPVQTFAVN